jgi:DNA-binding LacI/PurR family transcriptional regulator
MASTIVDVARRAGVSYQTVSNVINGRFSEMAGDTRRRVEQAIRELDFHPNQRARSLRRQQSQVIGYLAIDPSTNFIASPFTSEILAGIVEEADRAGYSVMVHAIRPRGSDGLPAPGSFSRLFRERRLDAAVVFLSGAQRIRERYLHELADGRFPFVVVLERFAGPSNASILAGDFEGGIAATEHLIELGHRTIGFITEDTTWPSLEARQGGYRQALARAGISDPSALVEVTPESPSSAMIAMDRLLDRRPDLTAAICFNDLAATGAIAAARRRGLRVPEDVSIVGFDDFAFAQYLNPPLTTVRMLGRAVGEKASAALITYLDSGTFEESEVVFPATLVVRGSTSEIEPSEGMARRASHARE